MKIFKMILNCVLPTVLVFSIVLNILLLCGFEFTRKSNTEPVLNPTTTDTKPYDFREDPNTTNEDNEDDDTSNLVVTQKYEETSPNPNQPVGKLVYDDTNIKVTYVSTQKIDEGIVHNFKIENLTKKTLTVSFTDIIINGTKVYISGLTCENLLPETDTVEEFVLYEKDWNSFTENPSDISFKIELVNSKSRLDWYESNMINMKF